jgi:hypothetical protein
MADLADQEIEELRNEAAKRSGLGKRTISNVLKSALAARAQERRQQERERRLAERDDPRPQINVPDNDAPWLPVMDALNEVIGASTAAYPPARDIDGIASFTGQIVIPETHAITSAGANSENDA